MTDTAVDEIRARHAEDDERVRFDRGHKGEWIKELHADRATLLRAYDEAWARGDRLEGKLLDAIVVLAQTVDSLVGLSLSGVRDNDGKPTPLQSWCDEGWTCDHPECVRGRAALTAADEFTRHLLAQGSQDA